MKHLMIAAVSALALAGCTPDKTPAPASLDSAAAAETGVAAASLADVVNSDRRSDAEKARDAWRNPVETLEFFEVTADKKVIEIWPGGGWYTNILAPWLASGGGTLVAAGFDAASIEDADRRARTEARLEEFKATYAKPEFGTIEYSAFSAASAPLTEDGTADVVLTFRNLHNWMAAGFTEKFFADYSPLKPAAFLRVEHRRLRRRIESDQGCVYEDM